MRLRMVETPQKSYGCSDPVTTEYAAQLLSKEDAVLSGVRARAQAAGLPDIHVCVPDGRHLQVLARALGAKTCVEVGTLAGYSGVCLLRGMGPKSVLHTLELDPAHARVAQETFRLAGFENQAHVHVGPALESLQLLRAEGPFDLVFIDADKPGYPAYLEWALENLRVGGVVLADNVFLFGAVGQPRGSRQDSDERVEAMLGFNARVVQSERMLGTLLPTGEGLAMGVKLK